MSLGGVLRSEWIKLRSLRSTVIVCALTVLAVVAFPVPLAYQHGANPIAESLTGVYLAPLTVSILGVLVITSEYPTGLIQATLCAVPRRLRVLCAKAVVLALAVFPVALISTLAAFLAGQARYGSHGVSLSAPGALRAVIGAALFLTVLALLGLGLGALIRNTPGGVAAAVGLTFVLPYAGDLLPPSWRAHVLPYLPMQAGQAVWAVPPQQTQDMLHPWPGFAVFCGYAAVTLAAAAVALNRRDATATMSWRDWARTLVRGRGRAARPPVPPVPLAWAKARLRPPRGCPGWTARARSRSDTSSAQSGSSFGPYGPLCSSWPSAPRSSWPRDRSSPRAPTGAR